MLIGEVNLVFSRPQPKGVPRVNTTFRVDNDGILHVVAQDADAEAPLVEVTFDRVYQLAPSEVEGRRRDAEAHRAEDEAVLRRLDLTETIARLRGAKPTAEVARALDQAEAALAGGDAKRASELVDSVSTICDRGGATMGSRRDRSLRRGRA